jgi:hypothetical protein
VEALRAFLTPLPLDGKSEFVESVVGGRWEGWPFGRDLYISEILALLQKVSGVRHVKDVQAESRRVVPSREALPDDEDQLSDIDRGLEVAVPIRQMLSVGGDGVLCVLEPSITIVNAQTGAPVSAPARTVHQAIQRNGRAIQTTNGRNR